jgi:hypothetical protein
MLLRPTVVLCLLAAASVQAHPLVQAPAPAEASPVAPLPADVPAEAVPTPS